MWRCCENTLKLVSSIDVVCIRLPIHHTHNRLDGYFGLICQKEKGKNRNGGKGYQKGQRSMSQQEWQNNVESALQTVTTKVIWTHCLYAFDEHYEPYIGTLWAATLVIPLLIRALLDKKFTGFGPGSPIRVMKFDLGMSQGFLCF